MKWFIKHIFESLNMKKRYNILLSLFFLISIKTSGFCSYSSDQLPSSFKIIPQPQAIQVLEGKGLSYCTSLRLKISGDFRRPVMGEILLQITGSDTSDGGILTLKILEDNKVVKSSEGYELTVLNGNAEIVSKCEAGLFYGCQTLEQLLEDSRDFNIEIPACKITDAPSLSYRAVHFDIKHHLDNMHYYYECIDRLARYKINAIIFEFEDKLRYEKQALVGAPHAISIEEMAALVRYARDRHIEISPLVQGLGHATYILKHPEYAHLREVENNRWAFCPLNEGTYQVLFDLYSDAIKATPGARYLHIGGDETGNIGLCPRCKPVADKEGKSSLQLYWLKKVCAFAEENDRIPIFWDDMPLKEAGVYETTHNNDITPEDVNRIWEAGEEKLEQIVLGFPENCVYMRWNYSMARQQGNIFALEWYKKHNLQAMIATAAQSGPACLFPFDEREQGMSSRGIAAIQSYTQLAAEKEIQGMLCTAWDDRSPHMETYWRGFLAAAEYSWSPFKRTLEEFDEAYLQREYGITMPGYSKIYAQLREGAVFWAGAFNKTGNRMDINNALFVLPGIAHYLSPQDAEKIRNNKNVDFTARLIGLPDLQNPGEWSRNYSSRLTRARQVINKYPEISQALQRLYTQSGRNRYHWEVFIALNNFQVTAPRLLLALEACDTHNKVKQKAGMEKVYHALNEFNTAWDELQKVYEKTRFLAYPPGYFPDRYYHFASQREDLTWMIQVEELFHQITRKWLEDNHFEQSSSFL